MESRLGAQLDIWPTFTTFEVNFRKTDFFGFPHMHDSGVNMSKFFE